MAIFDRCPIVSERPTIVGSKPNQHWWPNQLNLKLLHQNSTRCNPMGENFNYAKEFEKLDLNAVKNDLEILMTVSQDWWPADYGHYGPLFIRLAWHSAGTYRLKDGRGGAASGSQRFAPLNSWPDNANLDKARRLLWPIKQKYGRGISWADLMIFAGNCALESMGFKTLGFGGGREDIWEPEEDIYWGTETSWLDDKRFYTDGELEQPLAATQMGLIYVNPEGPGGRPDPAAAARNIRETFARMGMNDEETVALIAGGHTFGKAHGAAHAAMYVGPEPEGASIEEQGLGWKNSYGDGNGKHTITSGLEGSWTTNPISWDNDYFRHLLTYKWQRVKSPAGATQWAPTGEMGKDTIADAHDSSKRHAPMMFTTDLALIMDPSYEAISRRFYADPEQFAEAFAKSWYKLTHRDMGPVTRYLGPLVPQKEYIWQDPVPKQTWQSIDMEDIAALKVEILTSGLNVSDLVFIAWASASTFRGTDKRGGANGARIRLEPQVSWDVNAPEELTRIIAQLEKIQSTFNEAQFSQKKVSLADLIVLGGCTAVEKAIQDAGFDIDVPFTPGRTDALQEQTDVDSFAAMEPVVEGFRNYVKGAPSQRVEELLINTAHLLTLTAPEMTVLVGGLRVLDINVDSKTLGRLTHRPGILTNDYFVNLLDMSTEWKRSIYCDHVYEGRDRETGSVKWLATAVDLIFGSNSQLRAICEVYASEDGSQKFIQDFVAAWDKVMNLDRFDLS